MINKLIELNNGCTSKLGIATSDLEARQKVTEDAWYRFELSASEVASVYRTRRLTIQPVIDT